MPPRCELSDAYAKQQTGLIYIGFFEQAKHWMSIRDVAGYAPD